MSSFIPRTTFPFPTQTPSWFVGHMARSLRELPALLNEVDLVIEARDSRLPLTSTNPAFDAVLDRVWGRGYIGVGGGLDRKGKMRERMVVFTKRDLAETRFEEPLKKAFKKYSGQKVSFVDSRVDSDVREVLRYAVQSARRQGDALTDLKVLVVGMPNVGKSSLLNALRRVGVHKGKAFITGAEPGVTRRLTGTVKVHLDPPVYVYDTPGIMVPYLGGGDEGAERGLKLALTAGIKESLFEPDLVADYLLYKLNLRLASQSHLPPNDPNRHPSYLTTLSLPSSFSEHTNSLADLLDALALRIGALRRGGERDVDAACGYFLRSFREGKLGRWTLDDLDQDLSSFSQVDHSSESLSLSSKLADTQQESQVEMTGQNGVGKVIGSSLDERVGSVVQRFLEKSQADQLDAEEGRLMSPSQQKKAEIRAKAEERLAKAKARVLRRGISAGAKWRRRD